MKRYTVILTLSLLCALSLAGCGKKNQDKTDLTSTHTTAATETMSPTTTAAETKETEGSDKEAADGESEKDDSKKTDNSASVSTSIHTYTTGNISIEYPVVSNLSKAAVQETVNKLLNEHALEFIKAYGVDESKDSLTVKCRVVSADRRRLTAVYTGSYMPDGGAQSLLYEYHRHRARRRHGTHGLCGSLHTGRICAVC